MSKATFYFETVLFWFLFNTMLTAINIEINNWQYWVMVFLIISKDRLDAIYYNKAK